jgi:hypothetical protein
VEKRDNYKVDIWPVVETVKIRNTQISKTSSSAKSLDDSVHCAELDSMPIDLLAFDRFTHRV